VTNRAIVLAEGCTDESVRAHCLRVAAWASELAGALGLSEAERRLVEQTALFHHVPKFVLDDQARGRLLAEMRIEEKGQPSFVPDDVRQVLWAFWGLAGIPDAAMAKIVAVVEISDDFDQHFESEPLSDPDPGTEDQCAISSVETMMSYLQVITRADVNRVIDRLPVFPRAAREVIKHCSNPDVSLNQLETIASKDPVLAGRLIQTANSAIYSPRQPIGSIPQAIAYIGSETTRKVLLAAALRGNFSSMQLHQLWNHSLDVAQAAEMLAQKSKMGIDPSEAFLAGLVHDIGRLAFSIMPAKFLERFNRLTDSGCPPVEVEKGLAGRCHGDIGADTLTEWKFPETIAEAVRWHHRPERSSLALTSLLYLAEFISDSEEDLPSYVRMTVACRQAGIDSAVLYQMTRKGQDQLQSLRFAA
jgi:putative nucleotidyltransferase with HDIG domain